VSASFRSAVRSCDALKPALRDGLQAMKGSDAARVTAKDASRLTGSIDLDAALKTAEPTAARWDYGVGCTRANGRGDHAHWIEIHPCKAGEVRAVEAKLRWLRVWLNGHATALSQLPAQFVWVSSSSTSLSPRAPARRKLAQKGLIVAGRHYVIE
jgi:hypothetical protein